MTAEQNRQPELTAEQWAAGLEIAEHCDLGKEVLEQSMLWNGEPATVGYGLAHSAQYMDNFTAEEIRAAVFNGIADYQAAFGSPDGSS